MMNGLIVSSSRPEKLTIWNPQTARPFLQIDHFHNYEDNGGVTLALSHDLKIFAAGSFKEKTSIENGVKNYSSDYGVIVQRDGKRRFIGFGSTEVKSVRLSVDDRTLYVRTESGWSSWNVAAGTKLSDNVTPPKEEKPYQISKQLVSDDGKFEIVNRKASGLWDPVLWQVIEVATQRVMLTADREFHFVDANHVWSPSPHQDQSVILWDIRSGHKVWTATDKDSNALIMEFPDGHVRLSKGAEELVKLVRGFEIRPFDKLAKEFLER